MGGDTIGGWIDYIIEWLKSTPPAWAGTILSMLVQANLLA